jgi:CRISPR/Cas system-associated protein Cas10 (large subunit of type III CRISPR-Cas system)
MAQYRDKRLLELCRELPCQICGRQNGTIVAAHSNQIKDGKGTGIKAPDYRVAALCNECHFEVDNGNKLSKEEKRELWDAAHKSTIGYMFEHKMIGVLK